MDISDQITKVRAAINSYKLPQLLITAEQTGIFAKLSQQPSSASALAAVVGGRLEHVRRLANAMVAHGILDLDDDKYAIAQDWSALRTDAPVSLIGYLQYMRLLKERWALLAEALVDDTVSEDSLALLTGANAQTTESFIAAMDGISKPHAMKFASDWDFDNHRILDLGGGSGVYSIAVASSNKNVTGVVFDLPAITGIADKNIAAAGLSDRLTTVSGDYNDSIPGDGFDDAFLFSMIHRQDEEQNLKLLRRTFDALKPGGRLFVIGFFTNEQGTGPIFSAHFALEMTVTIPGGRVYTHGGIEKLIEAAGFAQLQRIDTMSGPATLYTAVRP